MYRQRIRQESTYGPIVGIVKTQFLVLFLGTSLACADNAPSIPPMPDPRPPIYRTFSLGEKAQQTLSDSIVIIAWATPPRGTKKTGYQIWGDNRILSKDQLAPSLRSLCKTAESWSYPPPLIVVGNQWGAGRELDPLMKALSKRHKIDTFYYGGSYGFDAVAFKEEEKSRKKRIVAAVNAGIKTSEQAEDANAEGVPE